MVVRPLRRAVERSNGLQSSPVRIGRVETGKRGQTDMEEGKAGYVLPPPQLLDDVEKELYDLGKKVHLEGGKAYMR